MPPRPKAPRTHVVDAVHRADHVEQTDRTTRADRADRAKMISVRLTMEEFDTLSAQATELGIGPSTLARSLIRRGLADQPPSSPTAGSAPSALEAHLQAYLQAGLQPDLAARVEALERWVADHEDAQQ